MGHLVYTIDPFFCPFFTVQAGIKQAPEEVSSDVVGERIPSGTDVLQLRVYKMKKVFTVQHCFLSFSTSQDQSGCREPYQNPSVQQQLLLPPQLLTQSKAMFSVFQSFLEKLKHEVSLGIQAARKQLSPTPQLQYHLLCKESRTVLIIMPHAFSRSPSQPPEAEGAGRYH